MRTLFLAAISATRSLGSNEYFFAFSMPLSVLFPYPKDTDKQRDMQTFTQVF